MLEDCPTMETQLKTHFKAAPFMLKHYWNMQYARDKQKRLNQKYHMDEKSTTAQFINAYASNKPEPIKKTLKQNLTDTIAKLKSHISVLQLLQATVIEWLFPNTWVLLHLLMLFHHSESINSRSLSKTKFTMT